MKLHIFSSKVLFPGSIGNFTSIDTENALVGKVVMIAIDGICIRISILKMAQLTNGNQPIKMATPVIQRLLI